MHYTPYKGPIRNFQLYLIKYTTENHLTKLTRNFPNIHKWTSDTNIDNISSNTFWTNPQISETQIKQLIKFCTNQYMGNARKHLFWPLRCPTLPVHFAIQMLLTPGPMSFLVVHNHIYMPSVSNAIIKPSGNYANF
jgi:hypothetical protein